MSVSKDVPGGADREYEPSTLKGMQSSIERHLKEKMYQASIITDACFFLAREAIASKCKDLKKKGKGNFPNRKRAPTQREVKHMWDSEALRDGTPTALQHTIWWIICTRFGKRANKENYCMEWEDIIVDRNDTGWKFLTVSERASGL